MSYSKIVDNDGYIMSIVKHNGTDGNITESEYNTIRAAILQVPAQRYGYELKLRADTLEWEYIPMPQEDDPDLSDENALDIITGGNENEEN